MKQQVFVLQSDQIVTSLFSYVRSAYNEPEGNIVEVVIREHKKDRSGSQRRLGHMWHGQVADQVGVEPSVIRNRIMFKLAIPIFYRDNIVVNGVYSADTIDVIRNMKTQGMVMEYEQMMMSFAANITTSSFNVKQNSEFLKNYENYAASQGWHLTVPDELIDLL